MSDAVPGAAEEFAPLAALVREGRDPVFAAYSEEKVPGAAAVARSMVAVSVPLVTGVPIDRPSPNSVTGNVRNQGVLTAPDAVVSFCHGTIWGGPTYRQAGVPSVPTFSRTLKVSDSIIRPPTGHEEGRDPEVKMPGEALRSTLRSAIVMTLV
jgi:hypothetical protein